MATRKCSSNFLSKGCSSPGLLHVLQLGAGYHQHFPCSLLLLLTTLPTAGGERTMDMEANAMENYKEGNMRVVKRRLVGMQVERREKNVMSSL